MASNPLFIIPDFFCIFPSTDFPNELCYLRFEGIFPFPSNLRQPQLSSFGKCKEKPGTYSILGLDSMPLSLKNLLLKTLKLGNKQILEYNYFSRTTLSKIVSIFKLFYEVRTSLREVIIVQGSFLTIAAVTKLCEA